MICSVSVGWSPCWRSRRSCGSACSGWRRSGWAQRCSRRRSVSVGLGLVLRRPEGGRPEGGCHDEVGRSPRGPPPGERTEGEAARRLAIRSPLHLGAQMGDRRWGTGTRHNRGFLPPFASGLYLSPISDLQAAGPGHVDGLQPTAVISADPLLALIVRSSGSGDWSSTLTSTRRLRTPHRPSSCWRRWPWGWPSGGEAGRRRPVSAFTLAKVVDLEEIPGEVGLRADWTHVVYLKRTESRHQTRLLNELHSVMAKRGWRYLEMMPHMEDGDLRGIWVVLHGKRHALGDTSTGPR